MRDFFHALVFSLLIAAVYLLLASRSTLWDRDEPRFSRAAVEMVESGQYLYPTFNGKLRAHKPILIYWLMSAPIRLLGQTEVACRFFGALGTAASCLLTWFIGRRLFDARAGLRAMLILATSLMMLSIGTMATADAVLLPCMLGLFAVFVDLRGRGWRWYHPGLAGLAAGGALLAKGPVGLLPLGVIIIFQMWQREKMLTGKLAQVFVPAVLIGALLFLAWGIPANRATNGEFARIGLGHHVVDRSLAPMEHHGGNFFLFLPYYLPVLIIGFFPWCLFLPGVLYYWSRPARPPLIRRLLLTWILLIPLIMTLIATKLPHYILLSFPALALATTGLIREIQQGNLTAAEAKWVQRGGTCFAPVAFLGSLGLGAGPWFLPLTLGPLRIAGILAGILLGLLSILLLRQHLRDRFLKVARFYLPLTAAAIFLMIIFVTPTLEGFKIPPRLVHQLKPQLQAGDELGVYKFAEPSLNFYLDRNLIDFDAPQDIQSWLAKPGGKVLIVPRDRLAALQKWIGPIRFEELASVTGINYNSRIRRTDVVALRRREGQP